MKHIIYIHILYTWVYFTYIIYTYDPHDPTTSTLHQLTTPQEVMPQLWHSRSWPLDLFGSHPGGPIWISPGNLWFNILPVFQMPLTMMYLCHNLWLFDDISMVPMLLQVSAIWINYGIISEYHQWNPIWIQFEVFGMFPFESTSCELLNANIYMFIMDLIWGIKSSCFSLTKPFPDKTTWQGGCRMTKQLGWLICSFAKNVIHFWREKHMKKINPLFHGCVSCTIDVKSFLLCHKQKTWNTTYIVIKWVIYLEKIPRDLFRTQPRKQHDKQKTCPYSQDGSRSLGLLRTLSQVLGPWSGHPQSVWKCCV